MGKLTEKEKLRKEKIAFREATKKDKAKKKKQFSRSALIKEADRVFSLYIRGRDAGKPCCTCGAVWQENFQAGHFMSRRHYHTRWCKINCHAQCPKCNLWGAGEQYKHSLYIDKTYGMYTARTIELSSMSTDKITDDEILSTIQLYYQLCFKEGIDYKPKKQYYEQV